MNDDKLTDLILKISTELATLNAQTKTVLDTLADHAKRLTDLEQNKTGNGLKDIIIQNLVKILMVCLGVIATLTGSCQIIRQIFGF